MNTPSEYIVDMHDPEILDPVAEEFRKAGIPAGVVNSGGGCFVIDIPGDDGYYLTVTPKEEDGRRWWISLNAPDGDYMGMVETEMIKVHPLPTAQEVARDVIPWIRRLLPDMKDTRVLSTERINDALLAASDAFWAKIVEHFPEVETGDFGPGETFDWEQACERSLKLWLHYNHPLADRSDVTLVG